MWVGNFRSHCPKHAQRTRLCDVNAGYVADNLLAGKRFAGAFSDYCSRGIAWMHWNMYGNCDYNQNWLEPNVEDAPSAKWRASSDCDMDGQPDRAASLAWWWR